MSAAVPLEALRRPFVKLFCLLHGVVLVACWRCFLVPARNRKADVDAAPQTARLAARLNLHFRAIGPAFAFLSFLLDDEENKNIPHNKLYKTTTDDRRQTTPLLLLAGSRTMLRSLTGWLTTDVHVEAG